jgi:hypothetical protein
VLTKSAQLRAAAAALPSPTTTRGLGDVPPQKFVIVTPTSKRSDDLELVASLATKTKPRRAGSNNSGHTQGKCPSDMLQKRIVHDVLAD